MEEYRTPDERAALALEKIAKAAGFALAYLWFLTILVAFIAFKR